MALKDNFFKSAAKKIGKSMAVGAGVGAGAGLVLPVAVLPMAFIGGVAGTAIGVYKAFK